MEENVNLNPKATLIIQIRDIDGNVIKEITKEEDPLTRWALRFLASAITGVGLTGKREDGATFTYKGFRNTYYSGYLWYCWAYKIAIGMDATPPTFEDYKLNAKERESTSITISSYNESDSSGYVDIKMDFLIETEKTFYEFGLFGNSDGNVFLVCRDVVSAGVTVPANSYLTVIYRVILGTV